MIWNLTAEQNRQGSVAEIFVYDQDGSDTLLEPIRQSGIQVHVVKKEPGFSVPTLQALRRLLSSGRFTRLQSHDLGALIYAGLANRSLMRRMAHVHTQHSFIHLTKSRMYAYYERAFCRLADRIVVVSRHQVADYARLGIASQAIENGIPFPAQNPFEQDRSERRRDLLSLRQNPAEKKIASAKAPASADLNASRAFGAALDIKKYWILIPGRLQKSKGQLRLFEVLRALPPEVRARLQFLILGSVTDEDVYAELRARAEEFSEQVTYLGFSAHPWSWLTSADAVISFSEFEGWPLVPLESLGLGIPTLLSRIEAHEFLREQADLFDLQDSTQVADWLQKQLDFGPRSERPAWDQARDFRERHSVARMKDRYDEIFREIR
jgi:glycosyltransferase involved in cell wall biosynthesis